MELKQLNKIIRLLVLTSSINIFSQMKMADIENKEFSLNAKAVRKNLIKILDDNSYNIYYLFDKRDFHLKKGLETNDIAKIIFYSKKYNKGIFVNFKQIINHVNSNTYKIKLFTGVQDKHMFVSSMAILDKGFNYEYFMKYYYLTPPDNNNFKSWILVQDIKNYCNIKHIDIKGNAIYENIDDLFMNILKESKNNESENCDPIIYDIDVKEFFPTKIVK